MKAKFWLQERRAFPGEEEVLARLHILFSALLPLLIGAYHQKLDDAQKVQLLHGIREGCGLIERFLKPEENNHA